MAARNKRGKLRPGGENASAVRLQQTRGMCGAWRPFAHNDARGMCA